MPGEITLFYWPTPNGHKIAIALEEMGLPYRLEFVNIGAGDQFRPEFLAISPNNRMPAIVDPDGPGGEPVSIFESGAILQYLARKTGLFGGTTERERLPYAQNRYRNEVARLYGVLDRRLDGRPFVAGDFLSIADMAIWPWAMGWQGQEQTLDDKPNLARWLDQLAQRPAFQKGRAAGADRRSDLTTDRRAQDVLFGKQKA